MPQPDVPKNFPQTQRPQPLPQSPTVSLDAAFSTIRDHLAAGKKFSDRQKDLCVEVLLPDAMLDQSERDWFREIAEAENVPLWVALMAQWLRAKEQGDCAALIVDPNWVEGKR